MRDSISDDLPRFFVLGAQKAATTSLDAWLRAQPGLSLPDLKETHYFSDDDRYRKGLDWYRARFGGSSGGMRGEVDPDYLSSPLVPARLAALIPDPKLVVIVREPLSRAHSQWKMSSRRGLENRPFARALEDSWLAASDQCPLNGHHDYFGRGCYARHLRAFRRSLPQADLLVLTFDELVGKETRVKAFVRLCRFVGYDQQLIEPRFDRIENQQGKPRSRILNRILYSPGVVRRAFGRLLPTQDLRLRLGVLLERINTARDSRRIALEGPFSRELMRDLLRQVEELEIEARLSLDPWKKKLRQFGEISGEAAV